MTDKERLTLVVTDKTKEQLLGLAGGERKMGEYVGKLVETAWLTQKYDPVAMSKRIGKLEGLVHAALSIAASLHDCPNCGRPLDAGFELDENYTEIFCPECSSLPNLYFKDHWQHTEEFLARRE